MYPETYHGSTERVSWSIEVTYEGPGESGTSTMLYGDMEEKARADFARRTKFMHRGKTMRLVRSVTVEAWTQHADAIETVTKATA